MKWSDPHHKKNKMEINSIKKWHISRLCLRTVNIQQLTFYQKPFSESRTRICAVSVSTIRQIAVGLGSFLPTPSIWRAASIVRSIAAVSSAIARCRTVWSSERRRAAAACPAARASPAAIFFSRFNAAPRRAALISFLLAATATVVVSIL
jgi:hypothetical protein